MSKVTMYGTSQCPFCTLAEKLLLQKGVRDLVKIDIGKNSAEREAMILRTGRRTVPQIFIDETHVGGFDDLSALDRKGQLGSLLGITNK